MSSELALDCRDLRIQYGKVVAVDGLSLQIHPGERVAILGSNGAGKTSLLNTTAGLYRASGGVLKIFGEKPGSEKSKRIMTYLPQVLSYPGTLKVKEIFSLLEAHHEKTEAKKMFDQLDIDKLLGRRASMLSGGETRKVGVISSLLSQPELVILDEPTANIDIEGCRAIEGLIEDYFDGNNKTLIFSSHVMSEVERLATRIVVLKAGKVVADGPKDAIKKQFGLRKVSFQSQLSEISVSSAKSIEKAGPFFHLLGENSDAILKEALSLDPEIKNIEISDPDLEEILLKIWSDLEEGAA